MCTKEAAKARIKKLEGDMLGLVYRLKRLNTQPGLFSTTSKAFNARSMRATLNTSFHCASRIEEELKLQIGLIRDELSALQPYGVDAPEFRMAA